MTTFYFILLFFYLFYSTEEAGLRQLLSLERLVSKMTVMCWWGH